MVTSILSALSCVTSAKCAPQLEQKYRTHVGEDSYCAGVPATQANAERGRVIQVVTKPPLTRRQIEQWQWAISTNAPLN
eukprot:gene6302-7310_t